MKLISIDQLFCVTSSKKFRAVFDLDDQGTLKTIYFGAKGYSDFTQTGDVEQRRSYLLRHKDQEDWTKPDNAGSLARWILWGDSDDVRKNIEAFKRMFRV